MADHIFSIDEIVAFVGVPNGIHKDETARWLAQQIQPVLDKRLRLDHPYKKITPGEWKILIDTKGWLIQGAVERLIESLSRFELLARIASRS